MAEIQIAALQFYVVFVPPPQPGADLPGPVACAVIAWYVDVPDIVKPIVWWNGRSYLVDDRRTFVTSDARQIEALLNLFAQNG